MQILIESAAEAAWIRQRLQAVAYALGPTVELVVHLPCGAVLRSPCGGLSPAARCASLNEAIEDALRQRQESRGSR